MKSLDRCLNRTLSAIVLWFPLQGPQHIDLKNQKQRGSTFFNGRTTNYVLSPFSLSTTSVIILYFVVTCNLPFLVTHTLYIYIFQGYCPEYNTYGAVVQAHFNLKCSEVQPPCPDRYLSTESYLCKFVSYFDLTLNYSY